VILWRLLPLPRGRGHVNLCPLRRRSRGERAPVKLGALRRRSRGGEVSWIIETKGRIWEGTEAKDAAMRDWCARVTKQTGQQWEYARINQSDFEARVPRTLAEAIQALTLLQG
jgi:hypothetical protein